MTDRSKVDDIIQGLEDFVGRKQKMKIQIEKLGEKILDLAKIIHYNFKKMNLLNDTSEKVGEEFNALYDILKIENPKRRSERGNNNNVFFPNNSLKVDEVGDWDDVYENE